MSARNSPSLLELFSIELLEQIFLLTSVQDILRLTLVYIKTISSRSFIVCLLITRIHKVNRACRELIHASPSILFELALFRVGLRRNRWIEMPVADCQKALVEHLKRRENFVSAGERYRLGSGADGFVGGGVVSGVCGLLWVNRARFFVMGSASRHIPWKEWEISLEVLKAASFAFFPQANIVAVAEVDETLG
jgi:hypothetical protein